MASKSNGVESTTWARDPPTDSKRWGNLLLCYFVFYLVLASQFFICLATSHQNFTNPRVKRLQQEYSLIGTSPGLEFRPLPPDTRSTLITYKAYSSESYKYWEDQLKEFLSDYTLKNPTAETGLNIVICNFESPPPPGKFCEVDVRYWHPCSEDYHFSYPRSSPCIFLKLNKIYGWRPEFYDTSSLPEDMPQDLQSRIKNITELHRDHANMVWVSCQGETPADREFIGPITYYPYPGFPGYFFPYNNTEGYMSPLVAVHFERPKSGIVINIECRAWAKNIQYNRNDHLGVVHFELMVD